MADFPAALQIGNEPLNPNPTELDPDQPIKSNQATRLKDRDLHVLNLVEEEFDVALLHRATILA
jgi:hypothetical protein